LFLEVVLDRNIKFWEIAEEQWAFGFAGSDWQSFNNQATNNDNSRTG
jgi:hypothetical protein